MAASASPEFFTKLQVDAYEVYDSVDVNTDFLKLLTSSLAYIVAWMSKISDGVITIEEISAIFQKHGEENVKNVEEKIGLIKEFVKWNVGNERTELMNLVKDYMKLLVDESILKSDDVSPAELLLPMSSEFLESTQEIKE